MLKAIRTRMQDDKGFTLIELMVVVLIIAILIAIAIPTFLGLRRRAQDRAAQSNLRNAFTAAKAYYTDCDSYDPVAPCGGVFNAAEGTTIEPSLLWADGNAVVAGQVNVTGVTPETVLVETLSQSGTSFCISESVTISTVKGRSTAGATFADYNACAAAPDW
jgi:type IV pilus assembly protein PilA